MNQFTLVIARMTSTMWVGAALLFVITSIAEQVHPGLTLTDKNLLALIRFPWFYSIGAAFIGVALLSTLLIKHGSKSIHIAAVLLTIALATMSVDYAFIYRPLRAEMQASPETRTSRFEILHQLSEWINSWNYLLVSIAAVCLCHGSSNPSKPHHRKQTAVTPSDEITA